MTPLRACLLLFALLLLGFAAPAHAQEFATRAEHAVVLDTSTDTVLFDKDAEVRMPPASMAKLMTTAVIFDAIKSGRLKLDDEFQVSENAWRNGGASSGGSTMFAKLHSSIKVNDLIHAIIIQSANDGCIVIAEGMAGSEAKFAELMNDEAKKLGLTGSHFTNATGLPDPNQYMTAHDLARLAKHIITDFSEFYPIYSQTEFTWNKIRQQNRNPLLDMNIGADGLKTGYTAESGYGLVGSAVRDGQRLILVINGAKTEKERAEEARKVMDWGFQSFQRVSYFATGQVVGEASVFGGDSSRVGLVSKEPVDVMLPKVSPGQVKAKIVYQGPVAAPVSEGQEVGTLQLTADDRVLREIPVYASADVAPGNMRQRVFSSLHELLLGWW